MSRTRHDKSVAGAWRRWHSPGAEVVSAEREEVVERRAGALGVLGEIVPAAHAHGVVGVGQGAKGGDLVGAHGPALKLQGPAAGRAQRGGVRGVGGDHEALGSHVLSDQPGDALREAAPE